MTDLVEIDADEVQDAFYERSWTDGLPIVPPTPGLVDATLAAGGIEPAASLGALPQRGLTVTAEGAAVNAVMAGCPPVCFPIVLAAVAALLDPSLNAHAALTSTGSASVCLVVSGPFADEVGMNAHGNVLGPGNRANVTIGRAVRLVAMNLLGARPGSMDGSSIGTPAKVSLCLAEDPPPSLWRSLREELGYSTDETVVLAMASEGPRSVANHHAGSGLDVLRTFAAAMRNPATFTLGKGGQVLFVIGPEHASRLAGDGWEPAAIREFLAEESRVTPEELVGAGVGLPEQALERQAAANADGKLPAVASASDVFLVTAGGPGPGWSAHIPSWAPAIDTRASVRRVAVTGEALPDCGDDACAVVLPPVPPRSERS